MKPRFEILTEKKLIGKRVKMSVSNNKTYELWQSFMPNRNEIQNSVCTDLYSIEIYPPSYWNNLDPNAEFEKWAAIEVTDFQVIPDEMETITLPDGLYGVFTHKGPASTGPKTYEYIFRTWLPDSGFSLDDRPHFSVMGQKYKNEDPESEEEIWIPIRPKDFPTG